MKPAAGSPWVYQVVYDDLPICGCGDPNSAFDLLRRLLALAARRADLCAESGLDFTVTHLLAMVLDRAGLIEHGITVRFPWPTAKGTWFLAATEGRTLDALTPPSIGFPPEGETPPWEQP